MSMEIDKDTMSPDKVRRIGRSEAMASALSSTTQAANNQWRDRAHQAQIKTLVRARCRDLEGPKLVLCNITCGGGKTLGAVAAYTEAKLSGRAEKMCVVTSSAALCNQYMSDVLEPKARIGLGHTVSLNHAVNDIDPSRGTDGYVTTYQALSQDSGGINLAEFERANYFLVLDEAHRLKEGGKWHRAVEPLFEASTFVLMMSGTLSRHDGSRIAFLPYMEVPSCQRK